jgi:paraquat-inducible protein B
MSEVKAEVSRRRRIPAIWLVPLVAFLLGIWMVLYSAMTEGPEITLVFSTAEGIEAGKTKVKSRSVQVGLVESVMLSKDLESVTVIAKLDRVATPLLRDDTRFWVVRPRLGAGGISGLGTIMSGAYIQLEPGPGEPSGRREFVGLDDVPVTPVGTPGLRLVLITQRAGSVSQGDPVLYRGFRVGRVEETLFDDETGNVRNRIFIHAPYGKLVNQATRFWNASGITLDASAEGVRVDISSLQTILSGGVAFEVPEGKEPGGPVEDGAEFELYRNFLSTREERYRHWVDYVVAFDQSVRGLAPGAPVEYRGIRIGTVRRVLLQEGQQRPTRRTGNPIPVLIRIEPGRMKLGDTPEGVARMKAQVEAGVPDGLRATLQSGSLLTGKLLVSFDFHRGERPGSVGSFAGYPTLPTLPGGLERIERRVTRLLGKLNDLPLEKTLQELNGTLAAVRAAVGNDEFKELPATLNSSLEDLSRTLQSVEGLSRTVEEQPSSLIFSNPAPPDPEPRSGP